MCFKLPSWCWDAWPRWQRACRADACGGGGAGTRAGEPGVGAARARRRAAGLFARADRSGRTRFAAQCGFCHGRDAAGGEGGTDLTRSALVATDVARRPDPPAPAHAAVPTRACRRSRCRTPISTAIVAFIHDQREQAAAATGGRRAVDVADLQTGNADAGKRYFDTACARCHSATGDLKGVATRYEGLPLLQRMLYPGSGGRGAGPAPKPPAVRVTLRDGQVVTGTLAYRDEFTISITDRQRLAPLVARRPGDLHR